MLEAWLGEQVNSGLLGLGFCSSRARAELRAFLLSHLNGDLSSINHVDAQGASHGRANRIRFAHILDEVGPLCPRLLLFIDGLS